MRLSDSLIFVGLVVSDQSGETSTCVFPPSAAPATRSSAGRGAQNKEEEEEQLIFSLDAHSSKELRHFKFLCVSFMAQLLASAGFIGKVSSNM